MKWRIEDMLSRKLLKRYSDVMLKSLDTYSDDTTLLMEDMIISEEMLSKIEQILKTNPTEEELIQKLDSIQTESYGT